MSTSPTNHNEPKIAPETPEMRSVLIRSAGTSSPSPSLVSSSPGLSFSKPTPVPAKSPPPASSTQSWSPCDPLPKVPEYYHLGNSHVKITAQDGSEIAHRIAECLSKQSIAATFTENQAIAETMCHTKLYVTLFEDEDQVIVEVQRRAGCGFVFSKCSKAILRAAKGMPASGGSLMQPKKFAIPASILNKPLPKQFTPPTPVAQKLVEPSQPYDSQMLGMQSLGRQSQEKDFSMDSATLETVLKHVLKEQDASILPEPYASKTRRDALNAFAGSLEHDNVDEKYITSRVVQQLLQDLLHDCPHVAYQAARCLRVVASKSNFKSLISDVGGVPVELPLKGKTFALEQETRKLQMELR